jgi:hypothetical protein
MALVPGGLDAWPERRRHEQAKIEVQDRGAAVAPLEPFYQRLQQPRQHEGQRLEENPPGLDPLPSRSSGCSTAYLPSKSATRKWQY